MGNHQENAKEIKALSDPRRLEILARLRSGEKCACVLLEPVTVGPVLPHEDPVRVRFG